VSVCPGLAAATEAVPRRVCAHQIEAYRPNHEAGAARRLLLSLARSHPAGNPSPALRLFGSRRWQTGGELASRGLEVGESTMAGRAEMAGEGPRKKTWQGG
jgi:hypothetical protein